MGCMYVKMKINAVAWIRKSLRSFDGYGGKMSWSWDEGYRWSFVFSPPRFLLLFFFFSFFLRWLLFVKRAISSPFPSFNYFVFHAPHSGITRTQRNGSPIGALLAVRSLTISDVVSVAQPIGEFIPHISPVVPWLGEWRCKGRWRWTTEVQRLKRANTC